MAGGIAEEAEWASLPFTCLSGAPSLQLALSRLFHRAIVFPLTWPWISSPQATCASQNKQGTNSTGVECQLPWMLGPTLGAGDTEINRTQS